MTDRDSIADASGEVIDVHRKSSELATSVPPQSPLEAWLPTLVGTLGLLLVIDILLPLLAVNRSQFVFLAFSIAVIVQVALHAAWILLGPGHFWLRIGSVPLFVALLAWMTSAMPEPDQPLIQLVLFEHWILVAACLFPLRALDFRVRAELLAAEPPTPANQFSISYLFGLLTLASFVIGVATRINLSRGNLQDPSLWFAAAILLIITVPPIPAVLMPRSPLAWALAAFFLPVVAVVLLLALILGSTEFEWPVLFVVSTSATELVLLAVLRLAGFRLRSPAFGSSSPTSEAGGATGPAPLQSA